MEEERIVYVEPQTRIKKSNSIEKLAKGLSKFQGEVNNPANTAVNPFFKSKYAPLNEVLNVSRPILAKYGLSVTQSTREENGEILVTTLLIHDSGEWIEFEPLALKPEKNNPQGFGSAITYGRRYTLSAALGISSEDDDDGNSASGNDKKVLVKKEIKKNTSAPQKKSDLQITLDKIDEIAKSKAKTHRDEVMKSITSHHTGANYNTIEDIEVAKKVLEELQNIQ